jgi:uncharacterized protein
MQVPGGASNSRMAVRESDMSSALEIPERLPASRAVAPVWHTIVLMAGIVALSVLGKIEVATIHRTPSRIATYLGTIIMELVLFGWVALGLGLRRVPLRSLFGEVAGGGRGLMRDLAVAFVFWIGALTVLGTIGALWTGVEFALVRRHAPDHSGQPLESSQSQREAVKTLEELAPANGREVAYWIALCLMAGLIEETVFRGYLQRQFTAWAHGRVAIGVLLSALLFGAAHGYQGLRNMVLLAAFGVLFSLLTIYRRGLRAAILAHGWHDMVAGLALAVLRSRHLI